MFEVAAVGLGGLGLASTRAVADRDDVRVVAGADPAPSTRASFTGAFDGPAYANHADLLANHDVDAALINTPHTLHYEGARDVLDAGVHVHLEKPFVTSFEDGVDLVERAAENDLALGVGYQR